jgi:hypothetical protein
MLGVINRVQKKYTNVIRASEIGQYHYCSISWYLQKLGYKPKSQFLEIGSKKHEKLGNIIKHTQRNMIKSKILAAIGYLLLILIILILIFEVIL